MGNNQDVQLAYKTPYGRMYKGVSEVAIGKNRIRSIKGRVQLVFTSPPFPLNRKKKYGNRNGSEYLEWLSGFAPIFLDLLKPDGSIVLELGNAWERHRPIMSTLALRALLSFLEKGNLVLCQQFIAYNPTRLPSPAQWVNVERIRVKDSFTHLWWMSKVDRPKANNRRILQPYSSAMEDLLRTNDYNSGRRPSGHNIGAKSFLVNNGGSIPPNVLKVSNTKSNDKYLEHCRAKNLTPHPARMPEDIAEFFINFLTEPGDLVFDPFAGSNCTGAVAERLKRKWVSIEHQSDYILSSIGRFDNISLGG